MLKKVFSIILIYSILLQGGTKVGIYAFFKINQDYISKVLCENRDKPAVHCNGKCYLSKQLKTQEEKDKKAPVEVKGRGIILFCSTQSIDLDKPFITDDLTNDKDYIMSDYLVDRPSIFHPPHC